MFGTKVFLISGVESPEALLAKVREILPEGWRRPYGGSDKTLEEIVFGPGVEKALFDNSLVPRGYPTGTLAISFATIDALNLAERMPTWISGVITRAVEQLGGSVDIKTIR